MKMDKLKPCPFCGKNVEVKSVGFKRYAGNFYNCEYLQIACEHCGYDMRVYPSGFNCTDDEKNSLIRRWNRRIKHS